MAKKKKASKAVKKAAKKTAKKTVRRAPIKKKKPKALPTGFLRGFLSSVLTKDNPETGGPRLWAWPPALEPHLTSYATIGDVVSLLGTALETSAPPGLDASGTFKARVANYANGYPWPTSRDYAKYNKPNGPAASTVNLYEMAQVADLMLQAIDGGGDGNAGGGGTRWPPVR